MIIIVAAIALVIFMINVSYTAINLALVSIGRELNIALNLLQWVMSAYLLAWGAFVIPGGRICMIIGRRATFLTGLTLFLMGSWVSGISSSVAVLIFGRIVMGLGAAMFMPAAWSLIYMIVPAHWHGRVIGFLSASVAFGLVSGSIWGAYVIEEFSWRLIFLTNIPVILLVMIVMFTFVKPDPDMRQIPQEDWLGMGLLAAGIVSLALTINLASNWGYHHWSVWTFTALGATLLTAFWFRDSKSPQPILPRDLLKNQHYTAILKASFMGAYLFSLIFMTLNLFLQTIQHYTARQSGIVFFALTVIDACAGLTTGFFMDRLGVKKPFLTGVAVVLAGFILFSFLNPTSSLGFVLAGLFCFGMGIGILWPAIYGSMFQSTPGKHISTAASLVNMSEILGEACGFIGATTVLMIGGAHQLKVILQLSTPQHTLEKAFMVGFTTNMIIGIILCIIMAWLGMRYVPTRKV